MAFWAKRRVYDGLDTAYRLDVFGESKAAQGEGINNRDKRKGTKKKKKNHN